MLQGALMSIQANTHGWEKEKGTSEHRYPLTEYILYTQSIQMKLAKQN